MHDTPTMLDKAATTRPHGLLPTERPVQRKSAARLWQRLLPQGTRVASLVIAASLALGLATAPSARADEVTVFAAASLKNALDAVIKDFTTGGHGAAQASYAASSALAKQIEQGAPADIFISADVPWMDDVAAHDLIEPESRVDLLGNSLVLIAPAAYSGSVTLAKGVDLAGLLGGGRLAMADVAAVPAGKYGKASLEALGAWDGVKDHVAQAENVRAALALVSRGEAPFGIVYATDAVADKGVKVVATFPEDSHPPIIYPAAIVKDASGSDTRAFFSYLQSEAAAKRFTEHGFVVLGH